MKQSATALTLEPQNNAALAEITPTTLLQAALASGNLELVREFMQLKREYEADEARKAYDQAMAEFKRNAPRISKNKEVSFGTTRYSHATLDHVTDVLTPALSKVGISHRFELKTEGDTVIVTCILSHSMGHSERTSLPGPIDKSGSKNPIQGIGSAVSYLQRYTLLAAVGMAPGSQDDDGRASGPTPQLGDEQFAVHQEAIENARSMEELRVVFKRAYTAADSIGDKQAMADLIKLKDKQKEILNGK